jgi:hypothetical protein
MIKKATLLNTKIVPSDTLPALAVASTAGIDVVVDTIIVTNTDGSQHNYELLIAENGEVGSQAVAIVSTNALAGNTAEIGNLAGVPFDVALTGGQSLYVKSDSASDLVFRVMGKKFSAGRITE